MKTFGNIPAVLCAAAVILGCDGALLSGGAHGSPSAAMAADVVVQVPAPQVVVEAPAPQFVEEGSVYNGAVVVAPPTIPEYVFINGGYYYWNPGLSIWVHAHHDGDWHPAKEAHIYNHWADHPQYRRK